MNLEQERPFVCSAPGCSQVSGVSGDIESSALALACIMPLDILTCLIIIICVLVIFLFYLY